MMIPLFVAAYATVLTAELMGDKLLYTISTLAARYRTLPMVPGILAAFMAKMAAATLLGGLIARLPGKIVAVASAITFITMALALSFKTPDEPSPQETRPQ